MQVVLDSNFKSLAILQIYLEKELNQFDFPGIHNNLNSMAAFLSKAPFSLPCISSNFHLFIHPYKSALLLAQVHYYQAYLQ